MFTVGITAMKLDSKFRKSADGRKGYNLAVTQEALAERYSNDEDLDRSLTNENLYWLNDDLKDNKFFKNRYETEEKIYGEDLTNYWNYEMSKSKLVDKNGNEKSRRSDTINGFAIIIKPPIELMEQLTEQQQIDFLSDSLEVLNEIVQKRGCRLDAGVLQFDEGNKHIHAFGHDEDYQASKKIFNLGFYRLLNETGYPKLMRDKGWSMVANADCYDTEAVKNMTAEEKEEYHEKRRKKRKNSGRKSAEYKLAKDLEKKRAATDKAYEKASEYEKQKNEELKRVKIDCDEMKTDYENKLKSAYNTKMTEVKQLDRNVREHESNLQKRENSLNARESDLQARETACNEKEVKLQADYENRLQSLSEALESVSKLQEEYQSELDKVKDINLKKQLEASEAKRKTVTDRIRRTNFQRGYEINNIDLQNSTEIDKEYE